jgi:hypothetical protein
MTNDERISAYIDNELTGEQEQELLISLAANDSLRKSFRSELVLKKVLRADERSVNPPRHLRTAVFAAIGLGAATAATAEAQAATAQATTQAAAPSVTTVSAPAHGLLKTLFASKLNALLTAAGLTVAGFAGYGVHTLVAPTAQHEVLAPTTTTAPLQTNEAPATTAQPNAATAAEPAATDATPNVAQRSAGHRALSRAIQHAASSEPTQADTQKASGVSGAGEVNMDPAVIKRSKK